MASASQTRKERKEMMFYVKGQTIPGNIVKVGADTAEVRNQTYGASSFASTAAMR